MIGGEDVGQPSRRPKTQLAPETCAVLAFIRYYVGSNEALPTYQQIADACGLGPASGAYHHVAVLFEQGHVWREGIGAQATIIVEPLGDDLGC